MLKQPLIMKKILTLTVSLFFVLQGFAQKESGRVLNWSIGKVELVRGKDVYAKFPLMVTISDDTKTPQLGTSTIRFFYDAGYLEDVTIDNVDNGYEISGFNQSRDVYGEVFGFEGGGGVFAQFDAIANQMDLINLSTEPVHVLDFSFRVKPGAKIPLCASLVLDNNPEGWGRGIKKDAGYLVNDSGIVGSYFIDGNTEELLLADDEVENFLWEKNVNFDQLVDRLNDKAGFVTLQKSNSCLEPASHILSVELFDFKATKINENKVLLDWITASEFNNDFFEVQRSLDGLQFERLGEVNGQWNAIDPTNYGFVDEKIKSKQHYYRLMMVDNTGQVEYSPIRLIEFNEDLAGESLEVSFYPNPTSGVTFVQSNKVFTGLDLLVFDTQGRLVLERQYVDSDSKLDLSILPAGIYKLALKNPKNQIITLKNMAIVE